MKARRLTVAGLLVLITQTAQGQSTGSTCKGADANSQRMIAYLQDLVTSTDSASVELRLQLGLPGGKSVKVGLVTNHSTCNSVVAGVNTAFQAGAVVRQVYVAQVGTAYAVYEPASLRAGSWAPIITLTSSFVYKGSVLAL